ncbi:MAG: putative membrane protein insertion efficiency factor [Bacteroidia bacterium]|nr:MAG: putative membrane protein insertion efficiency factor [Bacteroidia bacterium]
MKKAVVFAIKAYQTALSPILPFNHCRFFPSCSEYAIEAVERHGVTKGGLLAIRRLFRCHPFHKHSGYDPVPDPASPRNTQ